MKTEAPYLILTDDHPTLRKVAEPITDFNSIELYLIGLNMFTTMMLNNGMGLAANQVGILKRIIAIQTLEYQGWMINPEIIASSEEKTVTNERCLSFPNKSVNISRPKWVKVRAQKDDGTVFTMKFSGMGAKCIQHEIDHLNGIVFLTYEEKV